MKAFAIATLALALAGPALLAAPAHAQQAPQPCGVSGAWNCASPPASAAPIAASASTERRISAANPCLLVKHKGTIGRRAAWFFFIGIPIAPGSKYDYVDSIAYTSSKMAYGGKDLVNIQASGVHVIVLNEKFTVEDLDSARSACMR